MSIPPDRSPMRVEGQASTRFRSSSPSHNGVAAERFTDDLLVEILSRVPAKSLCRFKCVSNHWLTLINDPHHRKKLPQTLAGFFYFYSLQKQKKRRGVLVGVTCQFHECLRKPMYSNRHLLRLPDQPQACRIPGLLQRPTFSAGGTEFRYVVCNPATEKLVVCNPAAERCALSPAVEVGTARLGFDPAVSSHFYVFELVEKDWCNIKYLAEMKVYSSETGRWVHRKIGMMEDICLINLQSATVFLNGYLHFHTFYPKSGRCLAAVNTEGETLTDFRVPGGLDCGLIQQSQGHLHYANFQSVGGAVRLVVYVLEDCASKKWILKHSVETLCLFGGINVDFYGDSKLIAIHPDCNLIFFTVGKDITFMCYNMDHGQVKVICNLDYGKLPYLPYVPLYSELQSLDM